jgi:hypothetical protein
LPLEEHPYALRARRCFGVAHLELEGTYIFETCIAKGVQPIADLKPEALVDEARLEAQDGRKVSGTLGCCHEERRRLDAQRQRLQSRRKAQRPKRQQAEQQETIKGLQLSPRLLSPAAPAG